jgi:DNA-binding response OmpR family regulator
MEFGQQFDVFEANDGLQALSMLDWVQPDVILLDLKLPKLDGKHFLEKLHDKGVHAPVVVCSGAIPEGAAAPQGVQMAPKTGDLNHVRSAVRTAIRAAGVVARGDEPEVDRSEMHWRD